MEFLFPEYRLDCFGAGPSSPNKTGALLAIVFVAAWWPALRFRRGFWLSLPVAFVGAVFMLQTESRGALVGAGAAVLLLGGLVAFTTCGVDRFLLRPEASEDTVKTLMGRLKRNGCLLRGLSLVVAFIALLFYSHQLGVNDRMAAMTSGEDGSSNVRVVLYSAGMQMIAAAPLGWGHGEAGNAYGQWYQEIGDSRSYLSLVNSHLTWMAEGGMPFQFLYLAGWALVLLLCWPVDATIVASLQGNRLVASLRMIAFCVWVTLGLCGFFSSVLTLVWLWVIPVVLLLLCITQRLRFRLWPTKRQRFIAATAVLAGFVGLQAVGHALTDGVRIQASPNRVEIGENPKAVALIQPDRQVLGDKYGHTLREYLEEVGGFTVLRDTANGVDLAGFDTVILSGASELPDLRDFEGQMVWMNPPADVKEAALEVLEGRSLAVFVGSLGDWRRLRVWQSLVEEHPNWKLKELRGVADFIPAWPKYLGTLMSVNDTMTLKEEIFGYERSRVALAPDSVWGIGYGSEQGATLRLAQVREATLLRSASPASFWFKRFMENSMKGHRFPLRLKATEDAVITLNERLNWSVLSSFWFKRRLSAFKRSGKIADGGAAYA